MYAYIKHSDGKKGNQTDGTTWFVLAPFNSLAKVEILRWSDSSMPEGRKLLLCVLLRWRDNIQYNGFVAEVFLLSIFFLQPGVEYSEQASRDRIARISIRQELENLER